MIQVPDSVAFYWGDPINRAALNVLSGSSVVPGDLSLAEAERFELASLAARRVRVEHWTMLRALWAATWTEAVRSHLPRAKLLSYGDHRAFASETDPLAEPSVDYAWEQQAASSVYDLGEGRRFFTRVALVESARESEVQFYLIDAEGSCAASDDLGLSTAWIDDGASRRTATIGLLMSGTGGECIDTSPMTNVASTAVGVLAAALAADR